MISAETIYFHSFRNNEFNNYYYNKPFIILKYRVLLPLCYTSSELPPSVSFSAEI